MNKSKEEFHEFLSAMAYFIPRMIFAAIIFIIPMIIIGEVILPWVDCMIGGCE